MSKIVITTKMSLQTTFTFDDVLYTCNKIYFIHKFKRQIILDIFPKDIATIINNYDIAILGVFIKYMDAYLLKYGHDFNYYVKQCIRSRKPDTIIPSICSLTNSNLILSLFFILIKKYKFDINSYIYLETIDYSGDSYLYMYKPLFNLLIRNHHIYNKYFLDTLIDKIGYNINLLTTSTMRRANYDSVRYANIVSNILVDLECQTQIKNIEKHQWMIAYLKSKGALTIDQINKKLQQN